MITIASSEVLCAMFGDGTKCDEAEVIIHMKTDSISMGYDVHYRRLIKQKGIKVSKMILHVGTATLL